MNVIEEDIRKGSYRKVYLLYGDEDYLKDYYRKQLTRALIREDDTINLNIYDGREMNVQDVMSQADTLPFFSDHRLIIIRNSGLLKKDGELFAEYISTMPETSILLFVEDEVDKRSRLYKAIRAEGAILEQNRQKEDALVNWVIRRLKREGKVIQRSAMDLLMERAGNDMQNLSMELEKLIAYTYGKDAVTREDVEAVCAERVENRVFVMIDAIAAKDRQKALDLFHDLLFLRQSPLMVLALLQKQFQRLLQVKDLREQGFDVSSIETKTGLANFLVRKCLQQSSRFTPDAVLQGLTGCAQAEEAIKTGQMKDVLAVETLILKISAAGEGKHTTKR